MKHKFISPNAIGILASIIIILVGVVIIDVNYIENLQDIYLLDIKDDAEYVSNRYIIEDNVIYDRCYQVQMQKYRKFYDRDEAFELCKEIAEISPFISSVYIEYKPCKVTDDKAFCPCYDKQTKERKDLADPDICTRNYLTEDKLFRKISEEKSNTKTYYTYKDESLLKTRNTRLVSSWKNENVIAVINILLKPEYDNYICGEDSSFESNDTTILFNNKEGYIMHNTIPDDTTSNVFCLAKRIMDRSQYDEMLKIMSCHHDTIGAIFTNNNYVWTVVLKKDINTGMLYQTRYEFTATYLKRLIDIIGTFFISILLILAIYIIIARQTRKSKKAEEKRQHELNTAASIQASMLSQPMADIHQTDIATKIIPAKEIGGDLYYSFTRKNFLYFCIGDVSGKGLPAALFMSKTIALFKSISRYSISPNDIVEELNMELCDNNDQNMFVTMFIGILDLHSGKLQYCNAGHEPPLFWNGNDKDQPCYIQTSRNLPLGIEADCPYMEDSTTIPPGAVLLLYTDGVTEAKRKDKSMYGRERLLNLFTSQCRNTSKTINNSLLSDIKAFTEGYQQSDDITIFTMRVAPLNIEMHLKNTISELAKLKDVYQTIENTLLWNATEKNKLRLAIDEAVTNIVKYGFPESHQCQEPDITLYAKTSNGILIVQLIDNGIPFNPLEHKTRDIEEILANIDDIPIGGQGIIIIKKYFDNIRYSYTNGKNILTMEKILTNK